MYPRVSSPCSVIMIKNNKKILIWRNNYNDNTMIISTMVTKNIKHFGYSYTTLN